VPATTRTASRWPRSPLWEYLRRAYAAELEDRATGSSVVYYVNDHLLRDKQDAMDVLAKAAAAAREGVG
jgi:hypothetical protein